jgi:hypothetical protein
MCRLYTMGEVRIEADRNVIVAEWNSMAGCFAT